MDQSDKRQSKRVPYSEKVLINNSLPVQCHDVSEGGLFVHLTRALLPGSTVKVDFPETGLSVMALVQAVTESGVGLMFTKLTPGQTKGLGEIIRRAEAAQSVRKTKPSVLMVEDSENVRRLNKTRLLAEGFSVLEAADGVAAMKILGTEMPDVILLDLHMEKMDGYKVMSFLKQNEKLRDIPVVVLSSKFSAEEQSKVYAAGATEFLPKMTTSPIKLVTMIKNLIGKK
jgi:CheY-like chemotaxis protein